MPPPQLADYSHTLAYQVLKAGYGASISDIMRAGANQSAAQQ